MSTRFQSEARRGSRPGADKHVVIVGCGNIGSFLCSLVARIAAVASMTIIDPDRYEPHNTVGQSICRSDIGRRKALVQKRRVAEIDPRIAVTAIVRYFEDAALAAHLPDVILGALDSRAARLAVNQTAWRLGGVPVIDAGVHADASLIRMTTQRPGADAACLECSWSEEDYAAVEQRYSCAVEGSASPTAAPAGLGALAASLQALECQRLLEGADVQPREVILSAAWDRHFVTPLRKNPECRAGHECFELESLDAGPAELSFADLLCLAGDSGDARLRVEGKIFVRTLRCASCGFFATSLRLREELRSRDRRCQKCGGAMAYGGFDCSEWLDRKALGDAARSSLRSAGIAGGDILTVVAGDRQRHFVPDTAPRRAASTAPLRVGVV